MVGGGEGLKRAIMSRGVLYASINSPRSPHASKMPYCLYELIHWVYYIARQDMTADKRLKPGENKSLV